MKLKPQSHKYWIMVRGIAASIRTERDFLRCVRSFLAHVRALVRGPVTVGEHTVSLHLRIGRHKHVVDTALGEVFCFVGVEGAVLRELYAGGIV